MTKAGTYLIAHMNLGRVIEYEADRGHGCRRRRRRVRFVAAGLKQQLDRASDIALVVHHEDARGLFPSRRARGLR